MIFPSRLVEEAVNEISRLPGIGKKTALRLVLHLLKEEEETSQKLSTSIINLRTKIVYCKTCHNISDSDQCGICTNNSRDNGLLCVVEDMPDLLAIENTSQFSGRYHVLGGLISPLEGIGPGDLHIQSLLDRIRESSIKEIILALSPTMDGDTTAFYISRKLQGQNIKISTIARGVAIGGELEYTDEITLGRSILSRTSYQLDQQ